MTSATAAPDSIPPLDGAEPAIFSTLRQLDAQMDTYESPELQELARTQIPVDRILADASTLNMRVPSIQDAQAHVLVKWFKSEYFTWVDPIMCPDCQGRTQSVGMVPPMGEEVLGGASRVELHVCRCENSATCGGSVRFPRYNDLRYLMKTRTGRCGEWANLYTLFLRAMGLRARYVWNAEDHVWNEYFSPAAGWIHTDSCEAARNQPQLYEQGWGKKMSYIIAFSTTGATDVTRAYVSARGWPETLTRRTRVSEPALAQQLAKMTRARRENLDQERLAELAAEDAAERVRLGDEQGAQHELHARISGTREWKEARGEAGA